MQFLRRQSQQAMPPWCSNRAFAATGAAILLVLVAISSSEAALLLPSPSSRSCSSSRHQRGRRSPRNAERRQILLFLSNSPNGDGIGPFDGKAGDDGEEEQETADGVTDGFYVKKGPNGDLSVLDYEAVLVSAAAIKEEEEAGDKAVKDVHFWDAMESQNAARRKFGLPDLTLEQYVELRAENHLTAKRRVVEATADAFAQFDTNGDGVVCARELREGLRKILRSKDHLTERQAQKVLDHLDDSGDGKLQPDEFVPVGELRRRLEAVIEYEKKEMAAMMAEQRRKEHKGRQQELQQQEEEEEEEGAVSLIGKFFRMFEDTCQTNFDCVRPETCCDLGYRKTCCTTGETARNLRLEYATVPVYRQQQQ